MDVISALACLVWITLSCYFIQIKCQNTEVIEYSAANTSLFYDRKHGVSFAKFVKIEKKILRRTPIKVLHVKTEKICSSRCVENLNCRSINFARSNGQCELLDTDMFQWPHYLENNQQNQDFNHFAIKVGCLKWQENRPSKLSLYLSIVPLCSGFLICWGILFRVRILHFVCLFNLVCIFLFHIVFRYEDQMFGFPLQVQGNLYPILQQWHVLLQLYPGV